MNSQLDAQYPASLLPSGQVWRGQYVTVIIHTDTQKIASETCLFTARQVARGQPEHDQSPASLALAL